VLRLNFDVLLVHLKAFYFELICCSAIICVFSSHTFILLVTSIDFYYCFGCVLGTSIIGFMQEYFLVDGKVINSAFSADIGTDK